MARTKKNKPGGAQRELGKQMVEQVAAQKDTPKQTPEELYALALQHVEQSQPEDALLIAKQLWSQVAAGPATDALPALNLLGEISIELGAVDSAREYFEQAVRLDPEGAIPEALGGGAEKFLWLAQLCDEGGKKSVDWFERGAKALQVEIAALENGQVPGFNDEELLMMRVEKKRKLANALCGIVEVYMTDLSWEDDAETRCESLIVEALAVEDDTSPEVLQTLASVRLSQERVGDAQAALKRSLDSWTGLEPEDPQVPDFATKISLSRLLMDANLTQEAVDVLHRLIQEDDQSVEAWYLGGWCQHLIAEEYKLKTDLSGDSAMDTSAEGNGNAGVTGDDAQMIMAASKESRRWLNMSLKLYAQLEYEDDRLFQHAKELVEGLDTVLGPDDGEADGAEEEGDSEEWGGLDSEDEDEEMSG